MIGIVRLPTNILQSVNYSSWKMEVFINNNNDIIIFLFNSVELNHIAVFLRNLWGTQGLTFKSNAHSLTMENISYCSKTEYYNIKYYKIKYKIQYKIEQLNYNRLVLSLQWIWVTNTI